MILLPRKLASTLGVMLAFVLIGSGRADSLVPVRLCTDWYPEPEHGGFYDALVKGYYRDAGLDVTIIPGGPNIVPIERLLAGRAEFAMGSSDQVLVSNASDQGIIAVGASLQQDPQALMLHVDDPVQKFQDLDGRTIAAVPGAIWLRYLVAKFNLKNLKEIPATFTIANFLHDPKYIQQIYVTSEPFFVEQAGMKSRVMLIKDTGYAPYRIICCTQKYLQEHREIVRKFMAATVKGWRDYIQDPNAANTEILKRNPEMKSELAAYSWKAMKDGHFVGGPDGTQTGKFDDQRWQDLYTILRQLNVLTKDLDPKQSYTKDFTAGL